MALFSITEGWVTFWPVFGQFIPPFRFSENSSFDISNKEKCQNQSDDLFFNYSSLNDRSSFAGAQWQSVVTELGLVCDKAYLNTFLTQCSIIGLSVGSLFGGMAADRFGRKQTIVVSMICCIVGLVLPRVTRNMHNSSIFTRFAVIAVCRVWVQIFQGTVVLINYKNPF